MRRIIATCMMVAAGWLSAGCADEPDAEMGEPPLGEDPVDATDTVATGGADLEQRVALGIDSLPAMGVYLTDGEGRAVYLLEGEPAGTTQCDSACLEEWPPVLADQAIVDVSPGIQEGMVATMDRDGQTQITYNGYPLYYYHDDQGPGDTTGQNVTDQWGTWHLVSPQGQALQGGSPAG